MLCERILASLREDCGYNGSQKLLAGVSGGADSLCLLNCLHNQNVNLIVGHVNHSLRPEADAEEELVAFFCGARDIPFHSVKLDVKKIAQSKKMGIEEAARIERYVFLQRIGEEHGCEAIVLAHHADDQVETVLMHFLRGSGLDGLSGMKAVSTSPFGRLPVWRLMLGIMKSEILDYCKENTISFVFDQSNKDTSYFRNNLRQTVIPLLESLNPAFKQVMLNNAQVISSDLQILNAVEEERWQDLLRDQSEGYLALHFQPYLDLTVPLQRRVLRRAARTVLPNLRDLSFARVERLRSALLKQTREVEWGEGIRVYANGAEIQFCAPGKEPKLRGVPQLQSLDPVELYLGTEIPLAEGWSLSARLVNAEVFNKLTEEERQDRFTGWVSPFGLELPLEVRASLPGERWKPFGMLGKHQKISDTFVNEKIPRSARRKWPIVYSAGSLIWFCGVRISQPWRLLGDESQVLQLCVHPPAAE